MSDLSSRSRSPDPSRSPSPDQSLSDGTDTDGDHTGPAPVYLGHTRWKQAQPHTPGQRQAPLPNDDSTTRRRRRIRTRKVYQERHLSRDFFLILTFCFVLACFLICLTRPALRTWFSNPILSNPMTMDDFDEF